MSFDFRSAAQNATVISKLMEDRTRLTMDDVIREYPQGVTIVGFDIVPSDDKPYSVVICSEAPDKFFFGGSILTKIVNEWAKSYDGDIEKASADLAQSGGVRMQFSHGRTKNGNSLTLVKVL